MNDFVRRGYDDVAPVYLEARRDKSHDLPYLDGLISHLNPGDRILDVGCGSGVPIDSYLVAAGFDVTGIDISPVQIELARSNVPEAEFMVRDMSELEDGEFSVAAVVAFYSIFHTPRASHLRLLEVLHSFVPAGGRFLCTFGSTEWEGEELFFGTKMRWSHFGPDEVQRLIVEAGFVIELAEIVEIEFEDDTEHHLVVAAAAN